MGCFKMEKLNVGLFNDSFPPTIDGVANVTVNYARTIQQKYGNAVVATPFYPGVKDNYPFEVMRYPSVYISNIYGYRTGYPFSSGTLYELEKRSFDIIHSHCPVISTVLARTLRRSTHTPIVFTYHTKFDIDLAKMTPSDALRRAALKFLISNISACDEVWAVSEGAGKNLESLGYSGEWSVMPNGTDFKRGQSPREEADKIKARFGVSDSDTLLLFVGRMMWYKGIKTSLDGIKLALRDGCRCRFVLVGDGVDRPEIEKYVEEQGLGDVCHFAGAVRDREMLRAYFTAADLFLFPSTFDTNGIVVREAAACSCPSVLIKGSCAAEGIEDGETGIIIDDTPVAMAAALKKACESRGRLRRIGENAEKSIYLSWDDAVGLAVERYREIIKRKAKSTDDASLAEALGAKIIHINNALNELKEQVTGFVEESVERLDYMVDKTIGTPPSVLTQQPPDASPDKRAKLLFDKTLGSFFPKDRDDREE